MADHPSRLSDDDLVHRVRQLVCASNEVTADLVVHLGEVDIRKLFADQAYSSMFAWCVGELGLSEKATYKRITAAGTPGGSLGWPRSCPAECCTCRALCSSAPTSPTPMSTNSSRPSAGRAASGSSSTWPIGARAPPHPRESASCRPRRDPPPPRRPHHLRPRRRQRRPPRPPPIHGDGRRCDDNRFLEFHHRSPWARHHRHRAEEIELRCRAHNQQAARLDYSADTIQARIQAREAPP